MGLNGMGKAVRLPRSSPPAWCQPSKQGFTASAVPRLTSRDRKCGACCGTDRVIPAAVSCPARVIPATIIIPEVAEGLVIERIGIFFCEHLLAGEPFLRDVHRERPPRNLVRTFKAEGSQPASTEKRLQRNAEPGQLPTANDSERGDTLRCSRESRWQAVNFGGAPGKQDAGPHARGAAIENLDAREKASSVLVSPPVEKSPKHALKLFLKLTKSYK